MITDFIDSVVIIDDKKDEVEELQKVLEAEDIYVKFQLIDKNWNNNVTQLKKQKQLIFMDLSLDDSLPDIKRNVSERIRPILKKIIPQKYGCYGIVVWTKHINDVNILKEMLSKDRDEYKLPIFIIALDKLKYIKNSYKDIISDLNEELKKDKIAYFFINWINTVKIAANKAIYDIYSLIPDYNRQQTELLYLIYKMALGHTGIRKNDASDYDLTIDAYKAFDELLYSDLIHQLDKNSIKLFDETPQFPWGEQQDESNKIASKINSKLFIDSVNLNQNIILPGNVYEMVNSDKLDKQPDETKTIAIELTPPCDFANNKKIKSRIIKGFICDIKDTAKFKKDFYYKDMHPLEIDGIANSQLLLDFRYIETIDDSELQDENKYKLLFRVTHKLFADILQKFSSHSARLGISNLTF